MEVDDQKSMLPTRILFILSPIIKRLIAPIGNDGEYLSRFLFAHHLGSISYSFALPR